MILQLTSDQQNKMQSIALRCTGIKYLHGAKADMNAEPEDIKAIDCSGLVKYIYGKIGVDIPDGSNNQYEASMPLAVPTIGDVAFKSQNGVIVHIAFVLGNFKDYAPKSLMIIEASGSLGQVVIRDISSFKSFPRGIDFAGFRGLLADKVKIL
jgi:cell wall-associated NlpC family hydrolase